MKGKIRHQAVLSIKRIFYVGRGEPYTIQGHRLRYVPGTRPTRLKYARSKTDVVARYDALQLRLISENLQEGDTALDIGAHSGEYAIIMAAICGPTGRVIAFEPDPYARRTLSRNIKLNPDLNAPLVEKLAVSDCAGETVLYSSGGNSNSSLVQPGLGSSSLRKNRTRFMIRFQFVHS
jgi:tRNA A58 N-methylase Trm61